MSSGSETDIVVLLFAVILVMAMIAAAFLRRTAFPPLVGFIALGPLSAALPNSLLS